MARLDLLLGLAWRIVVEAARGREHVQPIIAGLERRGAVIERPLQGLPAGAGRAGTTRKTPSKLQSSRGDPVFMGDPIARDHVHSPMPLSPTVRRKLAALERLQLDGSGLYSWFVDEEGAGPLTKGLGHRVEAGLVYVGQTGATRWPSGLPSGATLLSRIKSQHLRGRRSASTLRRTFGRCSTSRLAGRCSKRSSANGWPTTSASYHCSSRMRTRSATSSGELSSRSSPPSILITWGMTPVRKLLKRLRKASDERPTD